MTRSGKIRIGIVATGILLNVAAWNSTAFCDWYTAHIFPLVTGSYGRLTSLFPFSVGERMIVAGLLWLVVLGVLSILCLIGFIFKKKLLRRPTAKMWNATGWILTIILIVMTGGCLIQYHCTPLEETLPGYGKEYDIEDLAALRDLVVENCNRLAEEMPRDENGAVVYEGGESEMAKEAKRSIALLGKTYSQLSGYQVTAKPMTFSGFISQQYMQGYYFPFSMEANYNELMEIMNKPYTMCHELSHTHGFIYEDDANFLAFLACVQSENTIFQYSGWLGVLNYVNNDFYKAVDRDTYYEHVRISDQVRADNLFLSEETWAKVEKSSPLETETVQKAADTYVDTTLKVNGVKSGKISYSHVVTLLLEYYDGEPESK